ncbi:MAG: AAA family ATPase [Candidatus Aenigmatarchaeota archaeon]|nr:MAG: AAA family ATPase [Candidatus Aenigmarchaeota archaeon]
MKKYLVDKKEEIKELEVLDRFIKMEISKEFVNAVIGPRRAGKSFFMFNTIRKLGMRDDDYLFVNFEDDEIKSMEREEITRCIQTHIEIYGKQPRYLLFDEIQNLERWQSFIYSLSEKKRYSIFITGSSSKLLSREITTQLRGRSLNVVVFPFSFREFLSVNGFKFKRIYSSYDEAKIKNRLREYLRSGGFPQVVLKKTYGKTFFREYLNVVLYRDLIERYKIENMDVARFLLYSAIQSFTTEFSIHKIFRQLKQKTEVSNKTVYTYSAYLEEVFFAFFLRKFYFSYKKSLLSMPKIYINDTGLASNLISFSSDTGKFMENLVFLELKKKELNNIFEIFYWKDYQGREVDFVVKEGLKVKQLIQVTYASGRDEIEKREIRSILKASKELGCKNLLIITWDFEGEEILERQKVRFVPLWKWLLGV